MSTPTVAAPEVIDPTDLELINWVKERIQLKGYESDMWKEEFDQQMVEYFKGNLGNRVMLLLREDNLQLFFQRIPDLEPSDQFMYYLKPSSIPPLTISTMNSYIQYGIVSGDRMEFLLHLMSKVFVPKLTGNDSWPESVKKELNDTLHRFMASLTESSYKAKGMTVLYTPNEELPPMDAVVQDKDLIQRYESTVIHWTRQVKDLLTNQDNIHDSEGSGPIEEILFWESRTKDLSGIKNQLDQIGVRTVVEVLEAVNSSYLPPFQSLVRSIDQGTEEAIDNLKFLQLLKPTCEELMQSLPPQIPQIIQKLLQYVRVVWSISAHYNTSERVTNFLRKISNAVIQRCRSYVSLEDIFGEKPQSSILKLTQCMEAGMGWKTIFTDFQQAITQYEKNPSRVWNFDVTSVFAQVDAFVQRCRDLIEVCEGKLQFSRTPDTMENTTNGLPIFGGTRGPDIAKSIIELEYSFKKYIDRLREIDDQILDVKSTQWHEYYSTFKNEMKELEVMFQNVITAAFDGVPSVQDGVELLHSFYRITRRTGLIRHLYTKRSALFQMFLQNLRDSRSEFESFRTNPNLSDNEPKFSGAALWAFGIQQRIERDFQLISTTHFENVALEAVHVEEECRNLYNILDDYIRKMHHEWSQSLGLTESSTIAARLDRPLMARVADEGDPGVAGSCHLICNFDPYILQLFQEGFYWQKLGSKYQMPFAAQELSVQEGKLRLLRENVMWIVRDYNKIIDSLTKTEKLLFQEHLRQLDHRIQGGLTKMFWSSKGVVDYYIQECRKHCNSTYGIVCEFKKRMMDVQEMILSVQDTTLLSMERNRVYTEEEFTATQTKHRELVYRKLEQYHLGIRNDLKVIYEFFKDNPNDVQRQWFSFLQSLDNDIEQALRMTVKKSLSELSKAINGDKKNEPRPSFKVDVIFDGKEVGFQPTMVQLSQSVNTVSSLLLKIVSSISRLTDTLLQEIDEMRVGLGLDGSCRPDPASKLPPFQIEAQKSFYDIIRFEKDMMQILMNLMNGMSKTAGLLQKDLYSWETFKVLWEKDKKEAYIKRLAKANRPLKQYSDDINRYKVLQEQVRQKDTISIITFIKIDCTRLKQSLTAQCIEWQNRLCGLLNDNVRTDLTEIYNFIKVNTEQLLVRPDNLDALGAAIDLLTTVRTKIPDMEKMFPEIYERYDKLIELEVMIPEEELTLKNNLQVAWTHFQTTLVEVEEMHQVTKQSLKHDLEESLKQFAQQAKELRQYAVENLPYGREITVEEAFEIITRIEEKVNQMREKETKLQKGLNIFRIQPEEYKDLIDTEKDLDNLKRIWTIAKEWAANWGTWKFGKFRELDAPAMDLYAQTTFKELNRLGRIIKNWTIWQDIKEKVDQFKVTVPLIMDLRNPAMRPRHWNQLKQTINKDFDPDSDEFTLEKVYSLGLHLHSEFISELSANANQELAIENSLLEIEKVWNQMELDIVPFKEKYHKIRSADDLFNQLEDNQVSLSTMKASRFYSSFEYQITLWSKNLSVVSDVVDTALFVQRQWIYLENIFMASEDIQKQLPQEALLFMSVNNNYMETMREFNEIRIALKCCTKEGMLTNFKKMSSDLDRIQKSLDQYLETKRQMFPRFYFLSNDDLLEILGQQKDPEQVQKHIKKCFVGINKLILHAPGTKANKYFESSGMNSSCGESVKFSDNVIVHGAVELWLIEVEKAMIAAIKRELSGTLVNYSAKREKWIKDWPGQLLITAGKIMWTTDCIKALNEVQKGSKSALKRLKKKQHIYLSRLADLIRGKLSKVDRKKLVALITMEIHSRDVIERMVKADCQSITDFEWLSQLRYYSQKEEGVDNSIQCIVKQTNTELQFGNEYQGNNGRLVITPLTDRCILTLTTALHLQRGGNPLGPAGTGKTETVKDLGKNLAKFVVVFNCSDGLDYKSVGRMFSGLVQSGGWGCFDEFNRIEVEVLSVVAQQIQSIMSAIATRQDHMHFEGQYIPVNWNCGIFVTMNPGYAGRSELPDNLKSLMRPVAMMVPDLAMIAEVMLMAEGFREARALAKKTVSLYNLMTQQLSKQDHYDYGLRSLKAVLNCAGGLKRSQPDLAEDLIVLRALRDMNVPKFIKEDYQLFVLLLADLFPGLDLPVSDYGDLQTAIERDLEENKLQKNPNIINKTIQLYESKATRHCNMLVGKSLSGKTTAWRTLANARSSMYEKDKIPGTGLVHVHVLNPKSVPISDLYGYYELATMEWTEGILSTLFRAAATHESPPERVDENWLMLDGPVDTLWIESMNTVMDDNKTLTLINGDRVVMSEQMSLLFEVLDLAVASPATVSRAGMVYLDIDDLGWMPFVKSWLARKYKDQETIDFIQGLFDKYVGPLLLYKKRKNVSELIPISDFNSVQSLVNLFDILVTAENGVDKAADPEGYFSMIDKWFCFCMVWSVCAAADEKGRTQFDEFIKDLETQFPPHSTIFDYFVDPATKDYKVWDEKVNKTWRPPPGAPFFKLIVPTMDTVRNLFIVKSLIYDSKPVLVVGNTGTGKTILVQSLLDNLPPSHSKLVINFSAASTARGTQAILEGALEKRAKDKLGPPGGKQMILFIDDLNMPRKDEFGSQPAIELLRQWTDYGGWYDKVKLSWKTILDVHLMAAMGPPGGGRSEITQRMQTRFNLVNFTFPADTQIQKIFQSILQPKFSEFEDDIRNLCLPITEATVGLYNTVVKYFLPTPTKAHYSFNLRDISKVVQGMLNARKPFIDAPDRMVRLWVHECQRVFSDRLINQEDRDKFKDLIDRQLKSVMRSGWDAIFSASQFPKIGALFTKLISDGDVDPGYAEVVEIAKLKSHLESVIEDYNLEPGYIPMNLVMFTDAVWYISRITRVLQQPRGNVMLVGVGGSGRQSLTRLSAYAVEMKTFSIEITRNYRSVEFHDDLKKLYHVAGVENTPTVFLFNDTQIKEDSFLEDINNILSSGEVPNLYPADELVAIYDELRPEVKKQGIVETPDSMWDFFVNRVRSNLHVVLCMSYIGDNFRNRCRMYPSLVNCCTITWFFEWPVDALEEVAKKFLENVKFSSTVEDISSRVSKTFAQIHKAVVESSAQMALEMKRFNYVTPTNYLELVKGYREVLNEKQTEIIDGRAKLQGGLSKLEESSQMVQEMSLNLEEKKLIVAKSQKECEELLVIIVGEKRVADEQQKQVEAEQAKIELEEKECKKIAASAEEDLNQAMPALEIALKEVDALDKNSISEVKAYVSPPPMVETVLSAVMILFREKPDWATAKKELSNPNFLQSIKSYDKDNVPLSVINKIRKNYIERPDFVKDNVVKISKAAAALCVWVHAISEYDKVVRVVAPKREALKEATEKLAAKQALLKESKERLRIVLEKVEKLNAQYNASVNEKNRLKQEADALEAKLKRAQELVDGLQGEKQRWEKSIESYNASEVNTVGDCLIGAGFLSYAGPFDADYRVNLVRKWLIHIRKFEIVTTQGFSFSNYLADPTNVREWNIQGLPNDQFSTENGVIVTKARRWPLMIDPQRQANKWIKCLEGDRLKVVDPKMKDFLRELENCIQFGQPYLMQDVDEELDPSLESVLNKAIIKLGNRTVIKVGDKDIDYNNEFRFYLTTKLGNPHYTPEVSTKTIIVNFAVKEGGLEQQLLGSVVLEEEPDLENRKSELVVAVASGRKKLKQLEDTILRLLSETKGSLLDDEDLVQTLNMSKTTATKVAEQLDISTETEKKIDAARGNYTPISSRASVLFFVLNDLNRVDPMYQFSLESYVDLFIQSIRNSRSKFNANIKIADRIKGINDYHTYAVYKYACRGLFEKHKLLLSLQMCFKILEQEKKVPLEEYDFFLRGGFVMDKSQQPENPCISWMEEAAWDNITELSRLSNFNGLAGSFEQMPREWKQWYMSNTPETIPLPGDWDNKLNELEHLIVLRSLRVDRVCFMASSFVANNLSPKYVDPPPFDLKEVYQSSSPKVPLIFVLSPGVDPTKQVQALAVQLGFVLTSCALGQGQAPVASRLIEEGIQRGSWVFLANCHLMTSWMPTLEKIIRNYSNNDNVLHPDFRLWLSSSPTPDFPITILQNGIKMTTEPPKGLKANLLRLYSQITPEKFSRCKEASKYKKLLFSLCWFHSVLLERRKFKTLGFNIPYDFNDSDFSICEDILALYLDEYTEKTPWDALRYLVAEANYGGRVTDDWDRRLVNVYIQQFFCEEVLEIPKCSLSTLPTYYIPLDGDRQSYIDYIRDLPINDDPNAFGQHPNADIASMIEDTNELLLTLVSLQPHRESAAGEKSEDKVLNITKDLVSLLPRPFNFDECREAIQKNSDPDPVKSVLLQEIERYNKLLLSVGQMLQDLQNGIKGFVVITPELESVYAALDNGKVPDCWGFCYPSLKPLGSWMRDLIQRVEQFVAWVENSMPKVLWLSGFTYPTGFLTALLQTTARRNNASIDSFSWTFPVINQDEKSIPVLPKDGAYVKGLFLEGARWDTEKGTLTDANPMELYSPMPIIHFKPTEAKKKQSKDYYSSPLYLYPVRTGTRERPSYMTTVELKCGKEGGKYWTKRGTALLLSLPT